ncbi:unnamed protein product [Mesocestoides corti]|uniref:mitogen-activated protein kinase n=1 Tax=Mesocestoides corti TaxID=53468 RepID=A0A158QW37_MESCO|nr:unnamed protein product [Mesocestoides corti]
MVPDQINGYRWDIPERYSSLTPIGCGAFGTVWHFLIFLFSSAHDNVLHRPVAIKRINKPFDAPEYAKRTYRELAILAHIDHENIITLIDVFTPQTTMETFSEIYLVMPKMAADLEAVIKEQSLDDEQITFLAYQILRALKYMHSANLIHRDLKPRNIAVDVDCNLRIIDFGLARQMTEDMSLYVVTRWYRAPEVIAQWVNYNDTGKYWFMLLVSSHGSKQPPVLLDIWSVACILVEMKTRQPLFCGQNPLEQLVEILAVVGKPDEGFQRKITSQSARDFIESIVLPPKREMEEIFPWASLVLLDLLSKMLVLDPDRRLKAAEALAHPYFADYHDECDEPEGESYLNFHLLSFYNVILERNFVPVELNQLRWDLPDRYSSVMVAGHGAYGTVSSARDALLQREVAIKKLDRPFENAEFAKRTYRELAILAQMDHENVRYRTCQSRHPLLVICLIDAFTPQTTLETFKDVYLVTPLMDADLGAIVAQQVLTDDQICFLAYQMLRALKYMHGAHIIHRDLKPSNIAVNSDVEIRIIDFGLARQKNHLMTGYVATRWYRAPEVMLNWMHYNDSGKHSPCSPSPTSSNLKEAFLAPNSLFTRSTALESQRAEFTVTIDVWSVACILVELKTRQPLFRGLNHIDQVKQIMSIVGAPDEELMAKITSSSAREFIEKLNYTSKKDLKDAFPWASPVLLDLLSKMLVLDPDRRLTAAQALAHPYFAEYHNESDEPVGEPLNDELIDADNLTVEEWKEATWNLLRNFKPKLTSLRPVDSWSVD